MTSLDKKRKLVALLSRLGGEDFSGIYNELERVKREIKEPQDLSPLSNRIVNLEKRVPDLSQALIALSDELISFKKDTSLANERIRADHLKQLEEKHKDMLLEFKEIRKELKRSSLLPRGGGSMHRQVSLDSTIAATRFSDINWISGTGITLSATNNSTTKKTDITVTSTASGGGLTKLTLVSGDFNQGVFTFSAPAKMIVVDQGRTITEGDGYTLAGSVATLDVYPTFSVTAFG